jgi:O-antigen/teichoic acid export membrane protein
VKSLILKFSGNSLASNTLIYSVSSIINSAIPFLLLPVLTNFLTPVEYGRVSTFLVVVSIASIFVTLELHGIISVVYYKNRHLVRKYIFNIITIATLACGCIVMITCLLANTIEEAIELPLKWILVGELVAFFQFISLVNLTIWQLDQKAKYFGAFQISNTLLNYGISVLLIVYLGYGDKGRIVAVLLSALVFACFSIAYLHFNRKLVFGLNKEVIKDSLKFGIPLLPHALSTWMVIGLDRIFINNYAGVEQNGIYTTGFQIASLISIVGVSFNKAFIPFLFKNLSNNDLQSKVKVVKVTYLYFIVLLLSAVALAISSPLLLSILVDEKYYAANDYILWIALGAAADGMYYGVVNYIFYVKKTGKLAYVTFLSGLLHVLLSFLLIPEIGALGAAYSTVTTQIITFVCVWILSHKLYPMPWFTFLSRSNKEL